MSSFTTWAQNCQIQLKGQVVDKATRMPLSYATLRIEENKSIGAITDIDGFFVIQNLCPDEFHIEVTYVGYEPVRSYVNLTQNMEVVLELGEYDELLNEIVVHGDKEEKTTEVHNVVGEEKIRAEGNKNLADVLESISGVSVIKNGTGVSKPVIHGLYGNRVAILNNGILQTGQQWGNDHGPEIDPFVADHISVVKGASALQYGGSSIGGVIMVDPYRIKNDPHLHGKATYAFQTNGLGHTFNGQLEKYAKWAAWRISGTIKYMGDNKAPNYYLTNTGKREANLAIQLEKQISEKWFASAYYSTFNTNIAILRGSHISNLTDLEEAIGRPEPFFTKDHFSYDIVAPHQEVNHHLLKLESQHFLAHNQSITWKYGGQIDNRREYDVRRGDRSETPALSLQLISHAGDVVYEINSANGISLKTGIQVMYTDNTNLPETGVLPLIPDYTSLVGAAFFITQWQTDTWLFETGGRYDFKNLNVVTISRTPPRVIERFDHFFNNVALSGGFTKTIGEKFDLSYNLGYAQRAPEVNELYSYGLHQGVSGIEEGSPDLVPEHSLKNVLSFDWRLSDKFLIQGLGYYQRIKDYIYLEPQEELRLTIRGAFPVYIYTQTNANIYGTDFTVTYKPSQTFKTDLIYSIVRGEDTTNDIPLIYMPSDNIAASFSVIPGNGKIWRDNNIQVTGKYVFEQTRIAPEQDFLPPPPGYFLLGVNLRTGFELKESHLDLNLRVENVLNTNYRDYLNRMRYFADEPGINFIFNVNYSF